MAETDQALAERQEQAPAVVPQNEVGQALEVISRAASDPNVDTAKLEKLLEMQERIQDRLAEREFSTAMANMQAELPQITSKGEVKDNSGNVRSHYAKFEDINEAVKPVLQRHGFSVSFRHSMGDGQIAVTCELRHSAGHRESTTVTLPADPSGSKNQVQAVGSSVSYAKRYALTGILNITTGGEDDDGVAAGAGAYEKLSAEQVKKLDLALQDHRDALPERKKAEVTPRFLKAIRPTLGFVPEKLEDIPAVAFDVALKMAQSKRKAA